MDKSATYSYKHKMVENKKVAKFVNSHVEKLYGKFTEGTKEKMVFSREEKLELINMALEFEFKNHKRSETFDQYYIEDLIAFGI
jgi:hypothetical protein